MQLTRYNPQANNHGLTDEAIRAAAPSVFATQPWDGVSDKYTFIPTFDVLAKMRDSGLVPVYAQQSTVVMPGKREFAKHVLRFRRQADIDAYPRVVDGNAHHFYAKNKQPAICEIVLHNAHDRSAGYVLSGGLFVLACSNGLIVSSATLQEMRVRHVGNVAGEVIDGSYRIIDEFPAMAGQVEAWRAQEVKPTQALAYAKAAQQLRWGDTAPVTPEQLLRARRDVDNVPTVWATFNRVQENLVAGGIKGRTQTNKRMTTRGVDSVNENTKLNKALWTLTQELSKAI